MVDLNPNISIIKLNIIGQNNSIKRQRWAEWIKNKTKTQL